MDAEALPDGKLKRCYRAAKESEARQGGLLINSASRDISDRETRTRLNEVVAAEADMVRELSCELRCTSRIPGKFTG